MRTVDIHYDGPSLDSPLPDMQADTFDDDMVNLEDVMASKEDLRRMRFLSLSTLVIDLAFTVRRGLERIRLIQKETEPEFALVTQ